MKNLFPMFHKKHYFLLLLMQRGNLSLPFFTPLCRDNVKKTSGRLAAEVSQNSKMCFLCSVRNAFCLLPMFRKNDVFEIVLTPTV